MDQTLLENIILSQESLVNVNKHKNAIVELVHRPYGLEDIGEVIGILKKYVPMLLGDFVTYIKFFTEIRDLNLNLNQARTLDILKNFDYVTLSGMEAYRPEGMVSTYLPYLTALNNSVTTIKDINKVLEGFNQYCATLVNYPEQYTNVSRRFDLIIERDQMRLNDEKSLNSFFTDNGKSICSFKDVVRNNNEFVTAMSEMNRANRDLNMIDRKKSKMLLQSTVGILNTLKKQIQNNQVNDASAETIKAIAEETAMMANLISHYTMVHYRALSLSSSIADTGTNLIKQFGDAL